MLSELLRMIFFGVGLVLDPTLQTQSPIPSPLTKAVSFGGVTMVNWLARLRGNIFFSVRRQDFVLIWEGRQITVSRSEMASSPCGCSSSVPRSAKKLIMFAASISICRFCRFKEKFSDVYASVLLKIRRVHKTVGHVTRDLITLYGVTETAMGTGTKIHFFSQCTATAKVVLPKMNLHYASSDVIFVPAGGSAYVYVFRHSHGCEYLKIACVTQDGRKGEITGLLL